jgi:hypothetical protein
MAIRIDQRPASVAPWFVEWRFPYNEELVNRLKQIPGCKWLREQRCWLVPIEVAAWLKRPAKQEVADEGLRV